LRTGIVFARAGIASPPVAKDDGLGLAGGDLGEH
jgi:hypothetical protein